MNKLHLICNAHIDPVWQWEWEEGAAAAVSTFRTAAQFCEEFGGFVFNHNEAILYKWIEEYEPLLFKRIQSLVKSKKWYIIGGWYLQPDCNMPSGESFVRQVLLGRRYFKEKFDVEPTTSINFDSFGHTRGLVQILKKSGYDSYIFMRPEQDHLHIPAQDFIWVGFDGSEIIAHRIWNGYNTLLGQADSKIIRWLEENKDKALGLVMWGVGNHGGGPSRLDLQNISKLIGETENVEIVHSIPEQYFRDLRDSGVSLPKYERDLNPRFIGCYTSQILIKQRHRLLENELFMAEKMSSAASLQEYMVYPGKELNEALLDLLTAEFHDILPGTSVQSVEETSLRLMDHGLEIASRLKTRAFFALCSGQEKAKEGEIPILVYNPHPYKVKGIFECEFMLPDQNWKEEFSMPIVYHEGERIPSQPEKENSSINLDWRKRVVFAAELEPSQINRFDCKIEVVPKKPEPRLKEENGNIIFKTDELEVMINCSTGLIDKYRINGIDYLKPNSFLPVVIDDNDDPWRMDTERIRSLIGNFELMSKEDCMEFSGVSSIPVNSVRVIEDGAVRSTIEAVLKYNNSFICQIYKLPEKGTEIEVNTRVYWNEKSRMLKLSIPTVLEDARYIGQTAYGVNELPCDGNEAIAQKWVAAASDSINKAITCINPGIYGSDFEAGEIRLSLLRSAGYCAHPIMDRSIMAQDRFSPRIDQGERMFKLWFNAGTVRDRMEAADREALVHNEKPFALSFFPSGEGIKPECAIELEDSAALMTAFKKAEDSDEYIIRLFEPTGQARTTVLNIPAAGMKQTIQLGKFEIKTLRLDLRQKELVETDLLEKLL